MRLKFFRHLGLLPLAFFQKRPVGELMYRSSNDIDASVPLLLNSIPGMFSAIYNALFYIFLIISSGATWLIYVLLPFGFLYFGVHFLFTWIRKLDYKWRVESQRLNATLRESVAGARVVKAFNKERFEALKYKHRLAEFYRSNQSRFFVSLLAGVLQKSSIHVGYTMLYPILGYLILRGNVDAIQFSGILLFCRSALYFGDMVYQNFQSIRTGVVPVQRLFETLDMKPVVAESPKAASIESLQGRIEFENVSFSYVDGTPILKNVSFTLEPGQKLGIVGPSGAGKSTITALLFRFWDPDSGTVRIDGRDVKTLKMNTVLKQMGVILQSTHLFSGSIGDNIRYAAPKAADDQVISAAKAAGLHDDVSSFPMGYQTDVGEGEKLSGGQRQRVSIARALVKNPKMLVMDEPTASLDPRTAATIGATLRQISADTTTLIISHRLSDVEDADLILVLNEGQIVERGQHEGLLAASGLYKSLCEQQKMPRAAMENGGEAYA